MAARRGGLGELDRTYGSSSMVSYTDERETVCEKGRRCPLPRTRLRGRAVPKSAVGWATFESNTLRCERSMLDCEPSETVEKSSQADKGGVSALELS